MSGGEVPAYIVVHELTLCHSACLYFLEFELCNSFTSVSAGDIYHLHKQDLNFVQAFLFL